MAKPTITEPDTTRKCAVIWQNVDDGVSEQAVVATTYPGEGNVDIICLSQGDHEILLNGETIKDLSRLLLGWLSQ